MGPDDSPDEEGNLASDYDEWASNQLSMAAKAGDLPWFQETLQNWRSALAPAPLDLSSFQSILGVAISSNRLEIVSFLLEQGTIISPYIIVPALQSNNPRAVLQTFLDHGWNINSKTGLGVTALKHVVSDEELTTWFLDHGADPNAFGKPGATILDVAAAGATPAVFDLLLKHQARLEDCDGLHSAAGELGGTPGRVTMMALLLDKGMDINALSKTEYPSTRGRGRETPLHAAVTSQQRDRIEFLIKRGADRSVKNTLGQTPWEYAVARGFDNSIKVLERL